MLAHLRVMDFSITPGKAGYYAWKVGVQVISPDGMRNE